MPGGVLFRGPVAVYYRLPPGTKTRKVITHTTNLVAVVQRKGGLSTSFLTLWDYFFAPGFWGVLTNAFLE